jgi:toxin secretion/phage lysis holin
MKLLAGTKSVLFKTFDLAWLDYAYAMILGIATWLFGDAAFSLGILLIVVIADFITGLLCAGRNGEIESSKMARTGYKLAAYVVLIAVLHIVLFHWLNNIPVLLDDPALMEGMVRLASFVPHVVAGILILREVNSILENLVAGNYIPESMANWLSKIFLKIREALEKKQSNNDPSNKINKPPPI